MVFNICGFFILFIIESMVNPGAIIVVIFSSLLKGITGFGFALLSLPFLMIWYSPKEVIPVLVMCNLLASVFIILQKKEKQLIDRKFTGLIIFGGVFTIAGVGVLKFIDENFLIQIVSVFFIVLCFLSMFKLHSSRSLPMWTYKMAGSLIGFLTGSISVSGPPLALFLNWTDVSNQTFREVFGWFSIVTSTVAIIGYFVAGLVSSQSIVMVLVFTPILLLGALLGKRLNSLIPPRIFKNISIAITLISCLMLLVSLQG